MLYYNEHSFDVITEESAYWLGFLMADGCVSVRVRQQMPTLSLEIKDLDHLEKFKKFMDSKHKIGHRRNVYSLHFRARGIKDRLATFGIVPNKSLNAKVIGLQNNRHFWRGIIDGDGCIGTYKAGLTLVMNGSKDLCDQFYNFVMIICPNIKATVRKMTDGNLYVLQTAGKIAKELIRFLYADSSIYLDRKFELAKSYF